LQRITIKRFKESLDILVPAPDPAYIDRKIDDEFENLSQISVINICKGCTHWELCVLKIQLEIYNLGNKLKMLTGSSM